MTVSRIKLVTMALAIFAVTVWLHWPSLNGEFLDVDDKEYVEQAVRWNGLTWNAVKWAFTSTEHYYHPLPRLSHVLDYQLWGKNAAGHHATSVFLHALNAALVFGFLWALLGATSLTTGERLTVALGVAMVFAIHPFQVESVAWMSGRTQLLCATFGIGSIWAYAAGARRWLVWGLFVLALLCKPAAISLPFAMLAIDYFPLRRFEQSGWHRSLWEKAAMFALAAAVGVAPIITGASPLPLETVPLSQRVLQTFQSLMFYPWRLVCPWHLSPFYPWGMNLSLGQWPVLLSVLSVTIITALAVWNRRRLPALAAGWGAYLAFVLPVSRLLRLGGQAPRHAYVAMLPLLLLAGGAVVWVWRRSTTVARIALAGLLACELCVFGVRARSLIPEWHSEETLRRAVLAWFPDSEFDNRMLALALLEEGKASDALEYATRAVAIAPEQSYAHTTLASVLGRLGRPQEAMAQLEQAFRTNTDSALAHYNFGVALMDLGKVPEAAEHFEQALRIKPKYAAAHLNLAAALENLGRHTDAIRHYEETLRIDPDFAEAHYNMGTVFWREGKLSDAIGHYEQALRIKPDYAEAHYNLGVALEQVGRVRDAIVHYEQALRIKPDYAEAHNNLGIDLAQAGKIEQAIAHFEQALRIKPDYAEVHCNLGNIFLQEGKVSDAISHYEQALRAKPDNAEAHDSYGVALQELGRVPEAIGHYEQALRINPDDAGTHLNLGTALEKLGRHADAIRQYEESLRIMPDEAEAHYNLAAALEKLGRVPEAIEHYQQALKLRPDLAPARNALARLQAGQ